jgi:Sigma-70 factor, region 1.2
MFEAEKPAEPERESTQEADLNSLAQSDSLRLYLREISRIPLLNEQSREIRMLVMDSSRLTCDWW